MGRPKGGTNKYWSAPIFDTLTQKNHLNLGKI